MINRLRTLLMNASAFGSPGFPFPGEEIIPAEYRPRSLPPYLQAVRSILFGSNPDRLYTNYRLAQYTGLLHVAGLEDPAAVSYEPRLSPKAFAGVFGLFTEGSDLPVTPYGEAEADDSAGRCVLQWQVAVESEQRISVVALNPFRKSVEDFEVADGMGGPVSLNPAVRLVFAPQEGASWLVTSRGRPGRPLADVLATLEAGSEGFVGPLFDAPGLGEYRNMWRSHPFWTHRFAALLKAVAVQTENSPTGGAL